jgi:hypothetical protein
MSSDEMTGAAQPSLLSEVPDVSAVPFWRRLLVSQEFWITVAVFLL